MGTRRENAENSPRRTPAERVYRALLMLQVDFQEANDDKAEEILCDIMDDFVNINYARVVGSPYLSSPN